MINIALPDELAKRLEEIAHQQNRSVADVLTMWLDEHKAENEKPKGIPNWDLILGVYDDDVTDMSTTVRETLDEYYKKKYGDPN